jgi:hypothetical protein
MAVSKKTNAGKRWVLISLLTILASGASAITLAQPNDTLKEMAEQKEQKEKIVKQIQSAFEGEVDIYLTGVDPAKGPSLQKVKIVSFEVVLDIKYLVVKTADGKTVHVNPAFIVMVQQVKGK